ncbi:hypothetical protein [Promicromonospora panici]|uniref:hypothetical protein n=1 Tax=Promicromonospora panici TaxID=2219658 RepID=UPI00101DEFD9|nr:hypothetical protein [Promicromonospora panici]
MDMHEAHGGADFLATPDPPEPEPRPPRRARPRGRGFVAALVAAALVLLGANAAMAYFTYRISVDEIERVEPVR